MDDGSVYGDRGNGKTYGWSSSHVDLARDRNVNPDQRLDTLVAFHSGGKWEYAVPNGNYLVKVSIGDAVYKSTHTVNVEGVSFWNGVKLAPNEFLNLSKVITVNDGKLTIDQGAAPEMATHIDYIEIAPQ